MGPLKFDWTITLPDLVSLLTAVVLVELAYADVKSDIRQLVTQQQYFAREISEARDEVASNKARQELIERRITDRLDQTVSKLDQLIGKVEARLPGAK